MSSFTQYLVECSLPTNRKKWKLSLVRTKLLHLHFHDPWPDVSKASCLHNFPLPLFIAHPNPPTSPMESYLKEGSLNHFLATAPTPQTHLPSDLLYSSIMNLPSFADSPAHTHIRTHYVHSHIDTQNNIWSWTRSRNHGATELLFKVSTCWKEEAGMSINGKKLN